MTNTIYLLLLLFSLNQLPIPTEVALVKVNNGVEKTSQTDHSLWSNLLQEHLDKNGFVNYSSFKKDINRLNKYLDYLKYNGPTDGADRQEKLAYYINLYNAATVKLIIDNYPLKSIKDLRNPWGQRIVAIGNQMISLGDLEHKILRKMNEPRIHFAINCASYSCPKLIDRAFTAANLELLLEQAAVDFINDNKRNNITEDRASLSKIFRWFKNDFTQEGSLWEYINRYAHTPLNANTKIDNLDYNWTLNDTK